MEKKVSRRDFLKASVATSAILTAGTTLSARGAYAKELRPIQLSKPDSAHAGALLKILEKRSSSREFAPDPLPVPVLSNVLWAGSRIMSITRPKRAFATSSAADVSTEAKTFTSAGVLCLPQISEYKGVWADLARQLILVDQGLNGGYLRGAERAQIQGRFEARSRRGL